MKGSARLEASGDGVLSPEEFPYEAFFHANDADSDGYLTMEELELAYRKQFRSYDQNGDGLLR